MEPGFNPRPYEIFSGQSVAEVRFSAAASFQSKHGFEVRSIYHGRYGTYHLTFRRLMSTIVDVPQR